jgi:hypothetical protein
MSVFIQIPFFDEAIGLVPQIVTTYADVRMTCYFEELKLLIRVPQEHLPDHSGHSRPIGNSRQHWVLLPRPGVQRRDRCGLWAAERVRHHLSYVTCCIKRVSMNS